MAFEAIKAFFRRGGFTTDTLKSPADHPKIGVDHDEYKRIQRNMLVYAQRYEPVQYHDAAGALKTREFKPLNVVKFTANWMATLLYNEKCRINIAEPAAATYIEQLFEQNNFNQNFQQYLEVMFAIGGIAIRPYYDPSRKQVKLSWALPDRFFPLESNTGEITEGVFITKTREARGKRVFYYSLFEFHEWAEDGLYVISHELYESDSSNEIGRKVDLDTLDKYADLPESTPLEGLTRPLFVYLKPATFNNLDPDSPLGIGMCDNARFSIETINVAHDKFRRNIDRNFNGIAVDPEYANTEQENGVIRQLHDLDDMFLAVPGRLDKEPYKEVSIPIQPEQYISTINFELRTYEVQTGFSPGTFVFDAKGLRTATEVVSEDSMTYQTRSKQVVVLDAGMADLVQSILELSYAVDLYTGPLTPAVTTDFDDGVFQDKDSRLDFYSKAVAQGMMPRLEGIKRSFNLTDEKAQQWYDAIQAEKMATLEGASRIRSDLAFGVPGSGD